jgi:hypothetical protein
MATNVARAIPPETPESIFVREFACSDVRSQRLMPAAFASELVANIC